jgi:hypothetical protein
MITDKDTSKKPWPLKAIIDFSVSWIMLTALAFFIFETWPKTLIGWILSITAGPLAFLIIELVGEAWHSAFQKISFLAKVRTRALERGNGKEISLYRMGYLLIHMVLFAGITIMIIRVLSSLPGNSATPIESFFKINFN